VGSWTVIIFFGEANGDEVDERVQFPAEKFAVVSEIATAQRLLKWKKWSLCSYW
jgi:hypothetical protein